MVAAAELIQPRGVLWLHPHHLGEVEVEGVPLQLDGRKEEWEEVVFPAHLGVVGLGGEFESSEMQEEGELPLIHQTRDDSLELRGAAPVMMTALMEVAAAGEAEDPEELDVVQPAVAAVE